jgi:hypothetical protein
MATCKYKPSSGSVIGFDIPTVGPFIAGQENVKLKLAETCSVPLKPEVRCGTFAKVVLVMNILSLHDRNMI